MAESFLAEVAADQEVLELYSWGWNEHGNLALGDKVDRTEPTLVPFDTTAQPVKQVVTGGAFFYLLSD